MSDYDNTNSGFIGKNHKKETDKHPDITGFINVTEPGDYWVSGWRNQKGYGLRLKKKEEKPKEDKRIADVQDDIPW